MIESANTSSTQIRMRAILWLLPLFVSLAATFQWHSGAWAAELGGHPDEAAHFVTTLMVRDYLAGGFPGRPMRFAEQYYDHYPKVALGHYPPVLYVVGALWLLVLPATAVSMLLLLGAISVCTALLLAAELRRHLSLVVSALAGLLLLIVPGQARFTTVIMADPLVSLLALAALLAWVRYLETARAAWAVGFGLAAAAVILTKTSGLWLAPLPLFTLVLSSRLNLLRRPSFWGSGAIVALLAGPWSWYTLDMMAEGMAEKPGGGYFLEASGYFSTQLPKLLSPGLLMLAAGGVVSRVILPLLRRQAVAPIWAAFFSLPLCVFFFHLLVPIGFESRYLLPALPSILALAAAGAADGLAWVAARLRRPIFASAAPGVLLLVGALSLPQTLAVAKRFSGLAPAARALAPAPPNESILISSDASGEGAFIAALAEAEPRPTHYVRRSSKLLARSNWMGYGYEPLARTEEALLAALNVARVRSVVVDGGIPPANRLFHHDLLERTLASSPQSWRMTYEGSVERPGAPAGAKVRIYQLQPPS